MKKQALFAMAALVGLAACTKETTQVNVLPQPTVSAFRVTGVRDITFNKSPFGMYPYWQMPLNVVYGNGDPQRVTLKLSGVPQGIKDSLTQESGYPDFSSSAVFLYENAANGTYKTSLEAVPDSGKTLTYTFNISVTGDTSCAGYFLSKSFTGFSSCASSQSGYAVSFTRSSGGGDTLLVNNFDNANASLKLFVDCNNRNIVIPAQSIGGFYYIGNGQLYTTGPNNDAVVSVYLIKYDASGNYISSCNYGFQ